MMTWLTRMSFLDTMEDLETPVLAQVARHSNSLAHQVLPTTRLTTSTYDRVDEVAESHPLLRMWTGYEIALAAYCAAACVELNRRGIAAGFHRRRPR